MKKPPLTAADIPNLVAAVRICEVDAKVLNDAGDPLADTMQQAANRLQHIFCILSKQDRRRVDTPMPDSDGPVVKSLYGHSGMGRYLPDDDSDNDNKPEQQRPRAEERQQQQPRGKQDNNEKEEKQDNQQQRQKDNDRDGPPPEKKEQRQDGPPPWMPPNDLPGFDVVGPTMY